eukprot:scaffold726_cov371-Pavlova_lutheri.AAC.6
MGKFKTGDLTKFPFAQGPPPSMSTYQSRPDEATSRFPLRKFLPRDWTSVPAQFNVRWDTDSKQLGWANEGVALVGDVSFFEKVNGIIPNTAIGHSDKKAIKKHTKEQYQLITPNLQNTWSRKAP